MACSRTILRFLFAKIQLFSYIASDSRNILRHIFVFLRKGDLYNVPLAGSKLQKVVHKIRLSSPTSMDKRANYWASARKLCHDLSDVLSADKAPILRFSATFPHPTCDKAFLQPVLQS